MKIELIKLKFGGMESYKYMPFTYCCEAIKNNPCIIFTNEDIQNYHSNQLARFCTSNTYAVTSYEDEWWKTDNYPIKFCPHCGEKINITLIATIDVNERYQELIELRKRLRKQVEDTDSKKEDAELRRTIRDLDDRIDDYYSLGKYKN